MRISYGKEKTNDHGKIEIPHSLIIPFTFEKESLNLLFRNTYPDLYTCCKKTSFITSRAILTTKNDFVDEINDMLISQFPNTKKVFIAIDETIDPNDQSEYEDFLHTLNPTGLPPYKLTLRKNCPIMLLRNLNPCEGLCNGTRLICNDFKPHVISATISSGDFKNTHFNMTKRYTINMITPDTKDWTCKVQDPLPPPRRLALTTFDTFEYQPKEFEFDVLAIVINGSPSTKTTTGKRIQEFIIMDKLKKPTKLTL
ncbi:hypothetical protein H5410_020818 [Solanum commersonii]|uniref:DNA helicase Pif1-like 2B domain-containing protein n=1 Tax=Solanum commersonii TaxID=4109 RepID=A0A9J5Z9I8_SOLCO|nr:hypothetical protein H5410_020818 [Solanum commersonii]